MNTREFIAHLQSELLQVRSRCAALEARLERELGAQRELVEKLTEELEMIRESAKLETDPKSP